MPLSPAHAFASPSPGLARQLRTLALIVQGLVLLGAATLLGALVWQAMGPAADLLSDTSLANLPSPRPTLAEFTPALRWRVVAVSAWTVAPSLLALWQLWQLFGRYRLGDVFGAAALRHLHRLGWALLALAVCEPVARAGMSIALSWDRPVGQRQLVVSLMTDDYFLLLIALVFLAVGRVMAVAAQAAAENEQFV